MIDYYAFHNYLRDLIGLYRKNRSLKGMSALAASWHCTALTKEQFFQMKLDKMTPEQVTPQLSKVIRDTIGRSDAKMTLRETIGVLNEELLAGSRVSQGSDGVVQITLKKTDNSCKSGWIMCSGKWMYLVKKITEEGFTWEYAFDGERIIINDGGFVRIENARRAKGPETARFVGALEREGYEWRVDNPNGLFFIKGKKNTKVEVFENNLPEGFQMFALPQIDPSPYRYALKCDAEDADFFMSEGNQPPLVKNTILRQLQAVEKCNTIVEYLEYDVPTLCCKGKVREYRVAFVRVNDSSYWLAHDRDVLRLLVWISYIV